MNNFRVIDYDSRTKVPIYVWDSNVHIDYKALEQAIDLASMAIVSPRVCVMPDAHYGRGSCVGTVIPTVDAVIPAAVGVDIGCGMIAMPLQRNSVERQCEFDPLLIDDVFKNSELTKLSEIRKGIERSIPVGFKTHRNGDHYTDNMKPLLDIVDKYPDIMHKSRVSAETLIATQYGTLGGGNHFVELSENSKGVLWIVIHSGSRGIGNRVGRYFTKLALDKCDLSKLPNKDSAYLTKGTEEFNDYMVAVRWLQNYAYGNRIEMVSRVLTFLREATKDNTISSTFTVNCHHNYISEETHFGQKVYVTRKGAVSAKFGERGIIPGSMGTATYIVSGLGNKESLTSCSHGAGREMSRSEAKRRFSVSDLVRETEGVACRKDQGVVDEIPSAYKNIDDVMESQKDLIETIDCVKQIVCVKG